MIFSIEDLKKITPIDKINVNIPIIGVIGNIDDMLKKTPAIPMINKIMEYILLKILIFAI